MALPQLVIRNKPFVLTGTMWKVRREIEADIRRHGGLIADRMVNGCTLIIASSRLMRGDDGKWSTRDAATKKADAAIRIGAMVYHEKTLRNALVGLASLTADTINIGAAFPQTIHDDTPQWNDVMQAKLEANLRETSELLAAMG